MLVCGHLTSGRGHMPLRSVAHSENIVWLVGDPAPENDKKLSNMSLVMRKPAFCICENKDTNQLRGKHEADQRLCFRYNPSSI